jgi:hypothetical protein
LLDASGKRMQAMAGQAGGGTDNGAGGAQGGKPGDDIVDAEFEEKK